MLLTFTVSGLIQVIEVFLYVILYLSVALTTYRLVMHWLIECDDKDLPDDPIEYVIGIFYAMVWPIGLPLGWMLIKQHTRTDRKSIFGFLNWVAGFKDNKNVS